MTTQSTDQSTPHDAPRRAELILALDVHTSGEALALVNSVPAADFVKVGLQLYTAEGPAVVQVLRDRGRRVFLDLKLHDIPNTVAGAVGSAARLGVDLLTIHASGGAAMMEAAVAAAATSGPRLLAVTVLTSFTAEGLSEAWGRSGMRVEEEVVRLARLASTAGVTGVVASVHEVRPIREALGDRLHILTPGIRLSGDAVGDQARVATPRDAIRLGADYLVIGRTVTGSSDPAAAYERVLAELDASPLLSS